MSSDHPPRTASLVGTCNERLALRFARTDPNYWNADFVLSLPFIYKGPTTRVRAETSTYALPSLQPLASLLAGNSHAVFEIELLGLRVVVTERTWGVRYGFVVEGEINRPWGRLNGGPSELAARVLEEKSTVMSLRFAFQCHIDPLREFHDQLELALESLDTPEG